LSGGNRGSTYFGYQARGWRLEDVIPVQISNAPSIAYLNNSYVGPITVPFEIVEAVI